MYTSTCALGCLTKKSCYVDQSLTIFELVLTVQQVFTDASRVLSCAQRLFDALYHAAQITQSLQYLCILVWQAHLCVLETLVENEKDNTV